MNAFLQSPFGLQPHLTPRFGAGNPFALGAPGMGGYGAPMKPQQPMRLGLPGNKKRKQYMQPNAMMGMVRPY